jgi:sugar lactone lactonase YvrE
LGVKHRRCWLGLAAIVAGGALVGPGLGAGSDGSIRTVAGVGVAGLSGDGGPATAAEIRHPRGIAIAYDGGFVFAEPFNATVRRVYPNGTITTIAGTGTPGFSGDGGPATAAELRLVHGVAFTPGGGLLLADTQNNRIRFVTTDGTITTVAGVGTGGYSGDGGPALAAEINQPRGLAALQDGGFLIADTDNQRIRRVLPDGTITTVAGSGVRGFSGDGGPAVAAALSNPFGVSPVADGGFLIADNGNLRIRRVAPDGTITTVAGTGVAGFSGDGGPAALAQLHSPHAVVALPDGGFLIADTNNNRVRRVWPDGRIETVAGTGSPGFSGDDGQAVQAELDLPKALAVLPDGQGFLVCDSQNNRVRLVSLDLQPPLTLRSIRSPLRSRVGHGAVLRYTLSRPAAVQLEVLRKSRRVLGSRQSGATGANALTFGRRLPAGAYRLILTATTATGQLASTAGTLIVSPPMR